MRLFVTTLLLAFLPPALCHSMLSFPQSTAPMTCRLGGETAIGVPVDNCAGPCDMRAINGNYAHFYPPHKVAAVFQRGQKVMTKYQRNNHGPGGFVRMTLVRPQDMMNKKIHEQNAFHFGCWGANPKRATQSEIQKDRFGYSITGNDGEQHNHPIGYYEHEITIPTCVPDGRYILGWAWYGGVGGDVMGNFQQKPTPYGYFSDYWSCSFIEIKGGPLTNTFPKKFINGMTAFSNQGCMSANDRTGVCTYEPCRTQAYYQKPKEFKNGQPPPLTIGQFNGARSAPGSGETTNPQTDNPPRTDPDPQTPSPVAFSKEDKRACKCIRLGTGCGNGLSMRTGSKCSANTEGTAQKQECKEACCKYCTTTKKAQSCSHPSVKSVCGL